MEFFCKFNVEFLAPDSLEYYRVRRRPPLSPPRLKKRAFRLKNRATGFGRYCHEEGGCAFNKLFSSLTRACLVAFFLPAPSAGRAVSLSYTGLLAYVVSSRCAPAMQK